VTRVVHERLAGAVTNGGIARFRVTDRGGREAPEPTKRASCSSTDQGGGKRRDASIKLIDLGQSTEFSAAHDVDMQVPENLPTSTNSIAIFVALCIFIFGGMAFAKFMGRRERE